MITSGDLRRSEDVMAGDRVRIAIVGCGDVLHRRYVPALRDLAETVELVGVCDARPDAADRAADVARPTWPDVASYTDLVEMASVTRPDAAINLTPAPAHAAVSEALLAARLHVYSEKPIARTLADADRLIAMATERSLFLLCAPGEAVTRRARWLADIVASGRLGRLTLAVAHHADTGPASWREYSGDPSVFYGPDVGPVFDHGVYRLHLMTALLGPVRRVQAMGILSEPTRLVRAGPLAGRAIDVTSVDHVLMNLEFANGAALGQLLSSFAAPGTQAPWLELHFTNGTISFAGQSWVTDAPASIYFDDDSPLGLEGWVHGLRPPSPDDGRGVIEAGVAHFVACLRGEETPILTAEHARHVLDIILTAYASIADGGAHETRTTF
jgi:predicted dehydrogenase